MQVDSYADSAVGFALGTKKTTVLFWRSSGFLHLGFRKTRDWDTRDWESRDWESRDWESRDWDYF